MLRVIKNEYGKELGLFEFDYLGEHPVLDRDGKSYTHEQGNKSGDRTHGTKHKRSRLEKSGSFCVGQRRNDG